MQERIKEIISDQWGNLMDIGIAVEQITQFMCDKCFVVLRDAKPDLLDWQYSEIMICYGFTEQQAQISYEKLKIG